MLATNTDGPSRWETAVRAADELNPTIGDEEVDGLPSDAWALLVHDLRTPAAAALGRAQLLRRRLITGTDDPARALADLAAIERALGRLLTRLETGGAFVEAGAQRRFLGGRLAAARRRAGLSQRALAGAAGLSHGTVARLERGEGQAPRLATIHRMANILRVAPADLVAWERDPAWEASEAGDD
ncbi:MAG: Helix-turn-helix domain [Thermomicrobiales bacterium]|nr:Helix-turn-helix domain [Thermomicrobiales bacterium]